MAAKASGRKEEKKVAATSAASPAVSTSSGLNSVDSPSFPGEEEKILAYWTKIDAFHTSLKMSEGRPEYTFYDGPPFATGLPHYGHILAGTIKDIVTRYAHQTGHHVSRRFGWDCHGLPVEYEIDQKLNIKSREDVYKMGIDVYNGHCRSIVQRYAGEWETRITRLGRWIDFKNDYKTMDLKFMESVWWVFSELNAKDLVYRGFKVMPYSTGCTTPLSNFEAGLNYKDVRDPAVVVSFPLKSEPDTALLAWTTTPWTLPSNLALCVNPKLKYVKVLDKSTGAKWIIAESRLVQLFPTSADAKDAHGSSSESADGIVKDALISFDDEPEDKSRVGKKYDILQTYVGTDLVGLKYEPIFPFFAHLGESKNAFRVVADDYVLDSSGTGIVHQAPAFGEDDYRVCETAGIISKGKGLVCPVDANGCYTDEVKTWQGLYVKKADAAIMKDLRARGRLIHHATIIHSYPFCWRSDQPLIYKAVPSWFIAVEKIKERLLATNAQTYWVPPNIKDGRFVNWLKDARDWAVSRNRYWGTPLPIWMSEDEKEFKVIGSVEELQRLSGVKDITDLHKDKIDHITIPSERGPSFGELKRVEEVFDCWFESGSMPYGQLHYPFENKDVFERGFPADFIAEGLDQTRGWFYTLMVLSTALFDKPAFKNLIVNGLVLADDGKKMSKRLKNYPDPQEMVDLNGADALRLYLINSPVVRAEPLRFQKDGVREVVKQVFLPWFNAYRFFVENAKRYETTFGRAFQASGNLGIEATNKMDRWILASLQDLVSFVHTEMKAYRLYTVTPKLLDFIEQLTNWYVRGNRSRARGNAGEADARLFLQTLFEVLYSLCRLMAPFTPFMVESMYQNLRVCLPVDQRMDSVHYLMVPQPDAALEAPAVVRAVKNMQAAVLLARAAREQRSVSLKRPILEVVVVHQSQSVLDDIKQFDEYVKEEVNVRNVRYTTERGKFFGAVAKPNKRALGHRLGARATAIMAAVNALTNEQVTTLQKNGTIVVAGETVRLDEVEIELQFTGDKTVLESSSNGEMLVVIDITPKTELLEEFLTRGVVAAVQKLVKDSRVKIGDAVELWYEPIAAPRVPVVDAHAAPSPSSTVAVEVKSSSGVEKKDKQQQGGKQKQQQQGKKEGDKAGAASAATSAATATATSAAASGTAKKEKVDEPKKDAAAEPKKEKAKKGEAGKAATPAPAPVAVAAVEAKDAVPSKKGKHGKDAKPAAIATAAAPSKKDDTSATAAAATNAAAAADDDDDDDVDENGEKKVGKRQLKKQARANEKAAASAKKDDASKKEPELKMPILADVIIRSSSAISSSLRRVLQSAKLRPSHSFVLGTVDADVEGQWVRLWVTRPKFSEAAIIATLAAASLPASHVAGVVSFLSGKDYGLLQARMSSSSSHNTLTVTIDNKVIVLQAGVHFFFTAPTPAAAAAVAVPAPVVAAPVSTPAPAPAPVAATVASSPVVVAASKTAAASAPAKGGKKQEKAKK